MKKIALLVASFFVVSCSSKKPNTDTEKVEKEITSTITSNCPEDGKCTATVYKNKKIDLLKDSIGKFYYQMSDSESTSVIKYEYIRNPLKGVQDSGYREEIVFELNKNDNVINYADYELSKQKFLFGRFCFCRGQTGYYQITKGNIQLKDSKLTVAFSTSEVPQIITSFTIDLK